ncbi:MULTISPECIES: SfnB family sulfur acquisition oxidoreductase [unclassified Rhizobium]|jgi:SfnB family sulfur acquisition oxidoreductase|uniref:SfnB family sulfur acquisition oxidoreductase n=1 Tax=unclassified Rhizobium TaxID=2613769 RepID=UPI00064849DF|nr:MULTISPECIES: SfnB family sulfur acquisition oxidoreductase [unclassified Rhizobium]MBN8952354.1 SfnB family sulfur acquisition oxidoreductase [Rhizobium tropici]OJY79712.1 MAG: SfnB family sulfur acquisition oxidoreductase [Rhizobium sp. 60-20]RKD66959.1 SfnB family sulfur acquisition oxidoreductase [Rhizobium sp. WW_1]
MGTVSQLHERIRPPAHRVQSEEEALDIARSLALGFVQQASDRDINRILPYDEVEALSQSGLLGISVPSEHGGIDISNCVLAEVIAILAEADPSIAQILQTHFHALEAIRIGGGEDQRASLFERAITGDRFGSVLSPPAGNGADQDSLHLAADGLGFRLNGRSLPSASILFSDWIALFVPDKRKGLMAAVVSRNTEGIQLIDDWDGFGQRTSGNGTAILHNLYLNTETVLLHRERLAEPTVIGCVDQLTRAGINLGIARAALTATMEFVRARSHSTDNDSETRTQSDPLIVTRIGEVAIRIEAATAMVERAGGKIDAAQINRTEDHVIDAVLAVAAAQTITADIAMEAADTLFELAGAASARIGLNLDRHWRNARIHTLHEPARGNFHIVGNYHLNGVKPPKSSLP